MPDPQRLLELIEDGIVAHGGDLGGWTQRTDDELRLFDGRVTLRAEFHDAGPAGRAGMIHAHVFTTLHEHDDEVLDACVMGMGDGPDEALRQVAGVWIMAVAGPIRSFLDGKPICSTCRAGVPDGDLARGDSPDDYGLPGLRAYVGPAIARLFPPGDPTPGALDGSKPWFRFAAEAAAPRRVHLAKVTVLAAGREGWRRTLEIDGHDVCHTDPHWRVGVSSPACGYLTRFAVFEFPRESGEPERRAELDRAIHAFAERYIKYESIDSLMDDLIAEGFDADLVHETESIATIAFGRTLFEPLGVQYSPTVILARRDGRVETDVPLMSLPAYARGRAIAAKLRETMPRDAFQAVCLYNAESHAIVQALEASPDRQDWSELKLFPCVVPERGASAETMQAGFARLQAMMDEPPPAKKPWWKFW